MTTETIVTRDDATGEIVIRDAATGKVGAVPPAPDTYVHDPQWDDDPDEVPILKRGAFRNAVVQRGGKPRWDELPADVRARAHLTWDDVQTIPPLAAARLAARQEAVATKSQEIAASLPEPAVAVAAVAAVVADDADLRAAFPTMESVRSALRLVLRLRRELSPASS